MMQLGLPTGMPCILTCDCMWVLTEMPAVLTAAAPAAAGSQTALDLDSEEIAECEEIMEACWLQVRHRRPIQKFIHKLNPPQ